MPKDIKTRTCKKCNTIKPFDEFRRYRNTCIECERKISREYESTEKCKSYRREYRRTSDKLKKRHQEYEKTEKCKNYRKEYRQTDSGKKIQRIATSKQRKLSPERFDAYNAVQKAIREGIMSPQNECLCVFCNNIASQYHHRNGYSEEYQLDVIPVCSDCHAKLHQKT